MVVGNGRHVNVIHTFRCVAISKRLTSKRMIIVLDADYAPNLHQWGWGKCQRQQFVRFLEGAIPFNWRVVLAVVSHFWIIWKVALLYLLTELLCIYVCLFTFYLFIYLLVIGEVWCYQKLNCIKKWGADAFISLPFASSQFRCPLISYECFWKRVALYASLSWLWGWQSCVLKVFVLSAAKRTDSRWWIIPEGVFLRDCEYICCNIHM